MYTVYLVCSPGKVSCPGGRHTYFICVFIKFNSCLLRKANTYVEANQSALSAISIQDPFCVVLALLKQQLSAILSECSCMFGIVGVLTS